MSVSDIAGLAAMLEGTGIVELTLTEAGERITLRRGHSPLPLAGEGCVRVGSLAESSVSRGQPPSPQPSPASGRGGEAGGQIVKAPCPGHFLLRHPLRDHDLAAPGQAVAAGAVVGLLRVGPLLVPVTAPRAGVLGDPIAAQGALVGFGTPLFRFNPEG